MSCASPLRSLLTVLADTTKALRPSDTPPPYRWVMTRVKPARHPSQVGVHIFAGYTDSQRHHTAPMLPQLGFSHSTLFMRPRHRGTHRSNSLVLVLNNF